MASVSAPSKLDHPLVSPPAPLTIPNLEEWGVPVEQKLRYILILLRSLNIQFDSSKATVTNISQTTQIYNFTLHTVSLIENTNKQLSIQVSTTNKKNFTSVFPLNTEFLIIHTSVPLYDPFRIDCCYSMHGSQEIFRVGSSDSWQCIPTPIPTLVGVDEKDVLALLKCFQLSTDVSGMCQLFMVDLRNLSMSHRNKILAVAQIDKMGSFDQDIAILYSNNGGKTFYICPALGFRNSYIRLAHNGGRGDSTTYALKCNQHQVEMMMGQETILTFEQRPQDEIVFLLQRLALKTVDIITNPNQEKQIVHVLKASKPTTVRDVFFAVVANSYIDTETLVTPTDEAFLKKGIHALGESTIEYSVEGERMLVNQAIPADALNEGGSFCQQDSIAGLQQEMEPPYGLNLSLYRRAQRLTLPLTRCRGEKPIYTLNFLLKDLSMLPGVISRGHFISMRVLTKLFIESTTNNSDNSDNSDLIRKEAARRDTLTRPISIIFKYIQPTLEKDSVGHHWFEGLVFINSDLAFINYDYESRLSLPITKK